MLPLDFGRHDGVPVALHSWIHVTAVLMRIPSKSATTGAGRSAANTADAVCFTCLAYKPASRQLRREIGLA